MKSIRYILPLLLLFTLFGCKNEEELRIPDTTVYLKLHLTGEYSTFRNSVNDTLVFRKATYGLDRIGYGGVLVYSDLEGKYRAFDLCCPYEVSSAIRVYPNDVGEAVCRECGSVYDIGGGFGLPKSGPTKWGLKRYRTYQSGDYLYISNN